MRLAATGVPVLRFTLPMLGKVRRSTGAEAMRLLGWLARGNEEAMLSSAGTLIRLGLFKA